MAPHLTPADKDFLRYSPDLNPLDFYVWSEIERRMLLPRNTRCETASEYKARLRRVARSLPRGPLVKAVSAIARRARAVVDAKGGLIASD